MLHLVKDNIFSANRLPSDHFLSGGLLGLIGGLAISFNENLDTKSAIKKTLKLTIEGSLATGLTILASNSIAQKKYLKAGMNIGAGLFLIKITNDILKDK